MNRQQRRHALSVFSGPSPLDAGLVHGRECGSCSVCCTEMVVHGVPGRFSAKPAGVTCQHDRGGCAVYERRPVDCRIWYCGWRLDARLTDDERPDKSGFMLATTSKPWEMISRPEARAAALAAAERFSEPIRVTP